MKDFPFFATQYGVASLTLKEIPYTRTAYIKIQDTRTPESLLKECIAFCRMAGAEKIFGANHPILEKYPFHTAIVEMTRLREGLGEADGAIFPVTEQTCERWRELYNKGMGSVPNFSYMSIADSKELLKKGNGYFIHRGGALLGIGMASGENIDAVVATVKGAGETVMLALNQALSGERIVLEVASENRRAVRLYERLGFIKTRECSRWYQLL